MDYAAGAAYMRELVNALKAAGKPYGSFRVGTLTISYPGYKQPGDYRLSENGTAPKHTDIVAAINNFTNPANFNAVVSFLDDVYKNGLDATSAVFSKAFKEKIYWITLQEEINYPQPKYAGRKLPFQRFYEAALVKVGIGTLQQVIVRTNNHGTVRPALFNVGNNMKPSFYV